MFYIFILPLSLPPLCGVCVWGNVFLLQPANITILLQFDQKMIHFNIIFWEIIQPRNDGDDDGGGIVHVFKPPPALSEHRGHSLKKLLY